MQRIVRNAGSAGPAVFGEFFAKNVDVLVADWDRGVELMVSTKGMTSSFGKNMTNRWEEFTGDLPWAHLDIAGTAWAEESKPHQPKGATGAAVRTLVELALAAQSWSNLKVTS